LLNLCDPNCGYDMCNYTGVNDTMVDALQSAPNTEQLALDAFGGQSKLDCIHKNLTGFLLEGFQMCVLPCFSLAKQRVNFCKKLEL
jgi:hypothetical protein